MLNIYKRFLINAFHKLTAKSVSNVQWLGVKVAKFPADLLVLQEIIWERKPDYIVECGTKFGGSALFMASILDIIGKGKIITIDNENNMKITHPRVEFIHQSSLEAIDRIKTSGSVMVCLDSDHSYEHVAKELKLYAPLVTKGQYLIVEDTHADYPLKLFKKYPNGGPGKAVKEFLPSHPEFVLDKKRERFLVTANLGGFLERQ